MSEVVVPLLRVLVVLGGAVFAFGLWLVRREDRRMREFFTTLRRHGWEEVE